MGSVTPGKGGAQLPRANAAMISTDLQRFKSLIKGRSPLLLRHNRSCGALTD
jgi:hypothetical protein